MEQTYQIYVLGESRWCHLMNVVARDEADACRQASQYLPPGRAGDPVTARLQKPDEPPPG